MDSVENLTDMWNNKWFYFGIIMAMQVNDICRTCARVCVCIPGLTLSWNTEANSDLVMTLYKILNLKS